MAGFVEVLTTLILMTAFSQVRSDASNHQYEKGDPVPLYVNRVGPFNNPSETYPYYNLPFCPPENLKEKKESLGEVLSGDRLVSSPFKLDFLVDRTSEVLCRKNLTKEEVSQFRTAIALDYYLQMYCDGLPIWAFIGKVDRIGKSNRNEHKYFIFTHLHFEIHFNGSHVIEVNLRVEPSSVTELAMDKVVVEFLYDVTWKKTNTPFEKRMEKYSNAAFLPRHFSTHRSTITNSFWIMLILIGCLVGLYVCVIQRDFNMDEGDEELADNQEESGWKILHGDVFRYPKCKSLFAAAIGSGVQLFTVAVSIMVLGFFGIFRPYDGGVMKTTLLISYVITCGLAGFTSVSLYHQLEGSKWVRNLFLTGCLFSCPLFLTFCFLNTIATVYGTTATFPVSSDLTIEVGTTSFALHKFPLVSRSGRIRKLLLEAKDTKITRLNLHGVPGGSEGFELAAKFCYGVNTEITLSNVAMLRCVAHFLEMTEEFSEKNLETRTEVYLKETVLPNISNSISVLHHCESLLPSSEEVNLVSRIINAIANNACKEQLTSGLSKLEYNFPSKPIRSIETETPSDWWGKSLAVLNLDFFQRVLSAVKTKGLKQDIISRILINYAQNSLQGLIIRDPQPTKGTFLDSDMQKKQRVIVETIVSLLPTQSRKSVVPMAFLSSLLKSAIAASASTSCRSDLERRIGLQLDQAILEDILIPSNSQGNNHNPLYDTDSILRIFSFFLNLDEDDEEDNHLRDESEMVYDFDSPGSPKQSSILKVSKLLDNYLAEVALDSNLTPSKFITLAELLPDHARIVYDGLYRAVDIFLKVHPNIKDSERYRLCKTIDCQKLSQEACSHAAQNERLPVQMAVQVLYFEQIRLRNAMNGGHNQFFFGSMNGQFPQRSGSGAGSGCISPRDNYASVRRENRELKLEVARMRMRLTDLEKDHVSMKQELVRSNPTNRLFKSFTKKLSKLNSLFKIIDIKPIGGKAHSETRFPFQKRRRHSVS